MDAYLQAGLHALGDPTRLAILRCLAEGPLPVVTLAKGFSVSRPAISQHLRVLKDAGLVGDQRQGTQRIYRIDPKGVEALRAHFDSMWSHVLANFQAAAEAGDDTKTVKEKHHARGPAKRAGRSHR